MNKMNHLYFTHFIYKKLLVLEMGNCWLILDSFYLFTLALKKQEGLFTYTRSKQRLTTSNLWWIFDGRLSVSFWLLFFCYVCFCAYYNHRLMLAEMVVGVVVVLQNDRKMKKRDREGDGEKRQKRNNNTYVS